MGFFGQEPLSFSLRERGAPATAGETPALPLPYRLDGTGRHALQSLEELLVLFVLSYRDAQGGGKAVKLHRPHDHSLVKKPEKTFFAVAARVDKQEVSN
jgi:hypothetical protein